MPTNGKRYLIVTLSVLIGIAYTGFDMVRENRHLVHPANLAPGQLSRDEQRFIFEGCITFYGTAYACGRLLYWLIGRKADSIELKRWSRWHMWLLNAMGALMLAGSSWRDYVLHGMLRPAFLIAVVLGVFTVIDIHKQWRDNARS